MSRKGKTKAELLEALRALPVHSDARQDGTGRMTCAQCRYDGGWLEDDATGKPAGRCPCMHRTPTRDGCREAIPPIYTAYIGEQLRDYITERAA